MGKRNNTYVIVFEIEKPDEGAATIAVQTALLNYGIDCLGVHVYEKGTDPISDNEAAVSLLAEAFMHFSTAPVPTKRPVILHNPNRR